MVLSEINCFEYKTLTEGKAPLFCCSDFLELNKDKVDCIRYFVGTEKKHRLAIAFGEINFEWRSPFSAPFSTVVEIQKETDLTYYWEFFDLVKKFAIDNGICKIQMNLPPDIYCQRQNAKLVNALLGNGFSVEYQEVNFSLNLNAIEVNLYKEIIHYNAKKNLNISLKSELSFHKCLDDSDKREAYRVIKVNRQSKEYNLSMNESQVFSTINIVNHEFFLVKKDDIAIASAIVFHINEGIVQVIYWGDIPGVGKYKPINYLAYKLIQYYKETGINVIDIGPSAPNGVPNFGLCSFKEGIGCDITSKLKFGIIL